MRNKQHIVLYLFLAGYVCFLMGCASNSEKKEKQLETVADSTVIGLTDSKDLELTFETDTLTAAQLDVFEHRAQQKLQDFINYAEIISNKSYNSDMRKAITGQAKSLFTDSTVTVNIPVTNSYKTPTTLAEFLDNVYQSDYDSIKVKTDSVVLIQPQKSKERMSYTGAVTAKVTIDGFKNGKIIFNTVVDHRAETVIAKTQKQFGTETKLVWTVTIGELK